MGTKFRPGDTVECVDDTHGAHFLKRGFRYVVASTQTDDRGNLRLNLCGMARAWESERFRSITQSNRSPSG